MTVIEIPTWLLWFIAFVFVANAALNLYKLWLRRRIERTARHDNETEIEGGREN